MVMMVMNYDYDDNDDNDDDGDDEDDDIIILTFLTYKDDLPIFVGQSSPSFPSTLCFQSCKLSFHINFVHIFPVVVDPSPFRPPLLLFPGTTIVHHFSWEVAFFSSPDVLIPI